MANETKTVTLRMPMALLKRLQDSADQQHRSLSGEILFRLENGTPAPAK